jgi:Arylsulfotransferase (ASST)
LEKFFLKKVELWVVGLLAVLVLAGMVVFGMLVRNRALGFEKFGRAGQIAYDIASIPATAKDLLSTKEKLLALEGATRFAGQSGWVRHDPQALAAVDGYVLISRFDKDRMRYVAELYDVRSAKLLRTWAPDAEKVFAGIPLDPSYGVSATINNALFRIIHPFLFANGDLLLKDHDTPMARVTWCGEKVWATSATFHHATEQAADGTFWLPGINRPSQVKFEAKNTDDDALVQVSPDGQVLASISVAKALLDNGYGPLVIGTTFRTDNDPIHLNDVQPVLSDGPYWKKGDLFVSVRHKSTIFQYRPSTGKVIWLRTGPWLLQHDVDVLDDGRIAVFSNNMNPIAMAPVPGQVNRIIAYDFATDTTSDLLPGALQREDVRTVSEGLFSELPGGNVLVEDENFGRLLIFAPDGSVAAEYINGASNGSVYHMGWSRYIDKALGDQVLAATENVSCNQPG